MRREIETRLQSASLSRFLRCVGTVHRLSTNIVVPDSGRAHAAGEPRRFFTFLFPPRGKRGRRPVTSESKHVTLPKGIAPTKKHDLADGGGRGGKEGIGILFETRRFLRYESHRSWSIIRLPHRKVYTAT